MQRRAAAGIAFLRLRLPSSRRLRSQQPLPYQNASADEGEGACPRGNTPYPLSSYVSFRFSAMLSTSFFYTRYTVDTQSLELSFEETYFNASVIALTLDLAHSGLHKRVVIPRFSITHISSSDGVATHNTQHGATGYLLLSPSAAARPPQSSNSCTLFDGARQWV